MISNSNDDETATVVEYDDQADGESYELVDNDGSSNNTKRLPQLRSYVGYDVSFICYFHS